MSLSTQGSSSGSKDRVFGLDILRASAILLVLASHSLGALMPLGVVGVEIFFVLSGYLVGGIFLRHYTQTATFTLGDVAFFLKRRWWRTLPNYLLFLGVFTLIAYFTHSLPPFRVWINYCGFLQNLYHPPSDFFGVSWSLTIEEWFYLLLPASVLLAGTIIKNRYLAFLVGILILGLTSLFLRLYFFDVVPWDHYARKIALGRLDALAWGCAIAWLQTVRSDIFERLANTGIFLCIAIPAMVFSILSFTNFPDNQRVIGGGGLFTLLPPSFAFCLPFFTRFDFSWIPRLPRIAITAVSLCSYSLYLVHLPMLRLFEGMHDESASLPVKLIFRMGGLASALVAALILYRWFELPVMNLRPKFARGMKAENPA